MVSSLKKRRSKNDLQKNNSWNKNFTGNQFFTNFHKIFLNPKKKI